MSDALMIDADSNALLVELAVVIPTFNEIDNVEELLRRLERVLQGVAFEVIFVDVDFSRLTVHDFWRRWRSALAEQLLHVTCAIRPAGLRVYQHENPHK